MSSTVWARSGRAKRATEAIERWVDAAGFRSLRDVFGATASDPDPRALTASLRRRPLALGGEAVESVSPLLDTDDDRWVRLVALEEFGDFCWNFRRGTPEALLHLVAARHHGGGSSAGMLPTLADLERWQGAPTAELLRVYLGGATGPDGAPTVSEALAEEAAAYPSIEPVGYQERWHAVDLPFSAAASTAIHSAADDLGLVTPALPAGPYRHVIVLGGGGRSPWIRAHYAAELIARHGLSPDAIWMLGSPRPIDERSERRLIAEFVEEDPNVDPRYLADTADEFDLMAIAAERAFGVDAGVERVVCGCPDLDRPCPAWQDRFANHPSAGATEPHFQHRRRRTYQRHGGPHVNVLSAATSRPPDRPNTADTYELLAEQANLSDGDRALIVTTQVFVPFQLFDALRMLTLPFGVDVDALGFGPERGDRPSTPEFELQEILSGLRSARRLACSIVEASPTR